MSESTTKVSVQLGPAPAMEFRDLTDYAIDSNVLTLMDTATVKLVNPGGERDLNFSIGDPANIYMSDPDVNGGSQVQVMKGRIIDLDESSDLNGGTTIGVTIGDLGWHLVNTCGPLYKSLMSISWRNFLKAIIDPGWGFAGIDIDNSFNRQVMQGLRVNNGRAAIAAARSAVDVFIPPVCFEAGDVIADKLISYARLVHYLVNVSCDGWLQIFQPDYTTPARFTLHHHGPSESERTKNNVRGSARVHQSIDGLYTDVTCIWSLAVQSVMPDRFNPHAGTYKSKYSDKSVLPFSRLKSFGEGNAMTQKMGDDRAKWAFERGEFDAWSADYSVLGHVMNGTFITPDTVCGLSDSVNHLAKGVNLVYISGRRFTRSAREGTVTQIQVHKPNFLRA